MEDIDLLPTHLRTQSLSDREIVLAFSSALEAIDILVSAQFGLLGWEGWARYPTGVGHFAEYQGINCTPQPQETWPAFIQRSADLCRSTISQAQEQFQSKPDPLGRQLYFCLTPISPA